MKAHQVAVNEKSNKFPTAPMGGGGSPLLQCGSCGRLLNGSLNGIVLLSQLDPASAVVILWRSWKYWEWLKRPSRDYLLP